MVNSSDELLANFSDARTVSKIALPVGEGSAMWKGERGEVMVDQEERKHRPPERMRVA